MPRLWTAQEADCLLNHIERHKGPEGKWIKNFSEAVEEVQLQLRSIKPSGVASLSKESIRWKIRTISNRVSERGRAQPQTLLFSKGPVVLKLRDKIYVGRGRTPASTVAGQQATEMSGRPPLRNAATSAKNQNQHANDRGNEPDQLDDDIADTTSLYMPDGTNLSLIHELCGTKGRPQKPISGNAISTNTQTQEWTNPIPDCLEQSTCSGHGIRRQSDQLATTLAVADAFPVQCHYRSINAMPNGLQEAAACQDHIPEVPVLEEWEKQILETFRKSFDVTGRAEPQAHTDVRSDMDNLYRQIRECMEGLEQSGDRRTIQYLPLSSDGVFLELGQLLFHGKQAIELIDKLSLVHGTYAVPLMDILRSLAAAALTWWPLNYFAECREQWTDHFRGPLERKMLQDAPSFHLRYFELLYLEHLKGEVADGIPIQARDLFVKFQAMFDNLVCGTKESVQAVDSTCQPGISEFSLWKTRARAHDTFRTKITALFRQRLRCHLEFEKSTLWYDYYFPRLDDLFDPNTMRTDQGQLVSCSSRVCLCLIPAIYSQEKTESGDGGRGERTIISKAIVIAF